MLNKRVLIIDDEESTRWSLGELLTRSGFIVELAGSTEEACDLIDNKEFDIIISDIMMPGEVNGLDIGQILKDAKPNVATIAMSGLGEGAAKAVNEAGFKYYLSKPFSLDELLNAISVVTQMAN